MGMAGVIQQAERMHHSLWILYIDLATMFPGIPRENLKVSQMVAGLPQQVIDLMALIYGERGDMSGVVECQFDSAAGLSNPFKNWMGALMGCVLSPDAAKIFLNTVITAIELVTKGVRLYGYGAAERQRAWRAVSTYTRSPCE